MTGRSAFRRTVFLGSLIAAALVVGAFVYTMRFDWFVRPALWRQVKAAVEDETSYWDGNIPLAASLLLVRAGAPGAVERLLAKLREPGNPWLESHLWETCLPEALVPGLEAMEREGFGPRIQWILAQRRCE